MVLFVSISYSKFAPTVSASKPPGTMSNIAPLTSSRLLPFLKPRATSQLWILAATMSPLGLIFALGNMIHQGAFFVGAGQDGNCKLNISYDRMAKKNTEICRLDVLDVAVNYEELIPSMLADCTNLLNRFVSCHV